MKFHNIQQNTDEWLDLRIGKVTGSAISKIMANYGKAFGDPAKKLAVSIAIEQLTGKRSDNDSYTNSHMQRGHEQEPLAREEYENNYFVDVDNGGFFDAGFTGCSPDGLVNDDGEIEIKSVIASVHYANIQRGAVDPAYKWQVYFNLLTSKREWIDFISYCADFPVDKKICVYRINADECAEDFKKLEIRLDEFKELVGKIKESIESY